jgi:hypothetical protein
MSEVNKTPQTIKRASIRPSPTVSIVQLVMSILFLIFGVALMSTAVGEARGDGSSFIGVFLVIWVVACFALMIYSIINLASFKGARNKPSALAIDVIEMEKEDESRAAVSSSAGELVDFETKLRKLEGLRKDGILTEDEYQKKKKEILEEKW